MTPASGATGWELRVTRFIDARPESVWPVMTGRLAEWWCPLPWRTEIVEQDWRAGGRSAIVMHGPGGERHPHDGIFLDVVPGVRFVMTDAFVVVDEGQYMPADPFMVGSWTLAPEGVSTRYTATARHWDEATMTRHTEMGFEQGWGVCADQLKALCEA